MHQRIGVTTAVGASRPLPGVPAEVGLLNPQAALDLGGGDYSSCPSADLRRAGPICRSGLAGLGNPFGATMRTAATATYREGGAPAMLDTVNISGTGIGGYKKSASSAWAVPRLVATAIVEHDQSGRIILQLYVESALSFAVARLVKCKVNIAVISLPMTACPLRFVSTKRSTLAGTSRNSSLGVVRLARPFPISAKSIAASGRLLR